MNACALLLLLLPVGQAQEGPGKIEGWIQDLDNDDIAIRARGQENLVKLGAAAIEPLKNFLKASTSTESQSRARSILKLIENKIRWDALKKGPVSNNLQAALQSDPEDPAKFVVEIANVGGTGRDFVVLQRNLWSLPGAPMRNRICHQALVTVVKAGEPIGGEQERVRVTGGPVLPIQTVNLGAGESLSYTFTVDTSKLEPGEYEVLVTYYSKTERLVPDAKEDLNSNVVRMKVPAPK